MKPLKPIRNEEEYDEALRWLDRLLAGQTEFRYLSKVVGWYLNTACLISEGPLRVDVMLYDKAKAVDDKVPIPGEVANVILDGVHPVKIS